jgi:2-amino-4-hydroxy-6-hydroxymethyldihydropteridine diphosphokinase
MRSSVERAAAGRLPAWASVSPDRLAHIERVAVLLADWAAVIAPQDVGLWRAAAWLHDALRDADPAELRDQVSDSFRAWPDGLLHGPAVARRLQQEDSATSPALLAAVTYHTVGHAQLGTLGQALYLADFLEPGRSFSADWRAALRARMPREFAPVLQEVAAARIAHLVNCGNPLLPETVDFWNSLVLD